MDSSTLTTQVLSGFQQMSGWEVLAVMLAIAYVILAIKERIECWYAALGSTLIFTFLFWNVSLMMESALQLFYIVMAVYGWYQWRRPRHPGGVLPIQRYSLPTHGLIVAGVMGVSLVSGYLLSKNTDAALPYLDSLTTWASVVTTYMVARKVLENWLYWIVIDAVSVFLYVDRGLMLTALLFVVYTLMAAVGYWHWRNRYAQQPTT